jgi:hypothetical protein
MFSTKIRTIIIGLVASAGCALAAAVPAVSQAQWHNYCVAGHCTTHANYTINDPCTSGTAAAASTTEAQKAEEEQKKKEEEEKEGQVHQGEIEKSFYGCDAETPPTSGGSSGPTSTGTSTGTTGTSTGTIGTSTETTTVSPVRILTAPVVLPAL